MSGTPPPTTTTTTANASGAGSQPAAAAGYFVDTKKGEVGELKALLKNINVEKDTNKKREIIKKVIAYMTLGIDVSRLFTDMIMAIETKDMVVKKMVYHYLCNYAHKEPDMAIMSINSLRRDCDNEDPLVRGLALRSLCGLRMESVLEYVQQPLIKSLTDISPYVRKTGVMGIVKLNQLSPATIENNKFVEKLYQMLQDPDSNVVINSIFALNELLIKEGGIEVTRELVLQLLNRISEFNEWGLNTVLDLTTRFEPSSEEEIYAIMNLLDPVLRTANSGAVLAVLKCFLKLTATMPEMHPQIISRSKPPILTLITGAVPEIQYTMLKHLEVILKQEAAKGLFDDEFRQFYVRYNEPPYVKHLKVDLMPQLANASNARDMAAELTEYVTDVDAELSKRAIHSIAEIGMRVGSVAGDIAVILVDLIELEMNYVKTEAVINVVNLIRFYPPCKAAVLPSLHRYFKRLDDPTARAALVWILGEYGDEITEAPYILEGMIDDYNDELPVAMKLEMLNAAMKLFFKRPPEMQKMLGRLLHSAINDTSNQDLHDRSLLCYRLLSTNVSGAANLFKGLQNQSMAREGSLLSGFAESREVEKSNKIFSEFNTLSVLYGVPSSQFIASQYQFKYASTFTLESSKSVASPSAAPTETAQSYGTQSPQSSAAPSTTTPSNTSSFASAGGGGSNLIDLMDDFNGVTVTTSAPKPPTFVLAEKSNVDMAPAKFQQLWQSMVESFNGSITRIGMPRTQADTEQRLKSTNVFTMAAGAHDAGGFKFFLFCSEPNPNPLLSNDVPLYLLQLVISGTGEVSAQIKASGAKTSLVVEKVAAALR